MSRPFALFILLIAMAAPFGCSKKKIDAVILITMESIREEDTTQSGAFATTDTTPVEQGTSFTSPSGIEDLDDIAYHGVRFSNHFSTSGSAFASLVSLHTGRPSEERGVYNDLDRLTDAPTLAETLALCGVRCGAFVARPSFTKGCGLERGFETYTTKPRDADPSADAAADARAWLDSVRLARPDQPVFLWLHLSTPRPPFAPREEFISRFNKNAAGGAGSLEALANFNKNNGSLAAIEALHSAAILQDAAAASKLLIGIAPTLQKFRSSMIIFAGSNGEELGGRGTFGSARGPREAALHTPLFVWFSGIVNLPKVASPVVDSTDITVTIARAFAASPPDGSRGRDLFDIVKDPAAAERVAFSSWENRIFTIRTRGERFICNPLGLAPGGWPGGALASPNEELYHPAGDPGELNNLVSASAQRAARLREIIERERALVRAKPPNIEINPERLNLLKSEGIHGGHEHPAGPPPASTCGAKY